MRPARRTGTIAKLRRHPALRALWQEWETGDVVEAEARGLELTDAEINAVYTLARTPDDQRVLDKLMVLVASEASSTSFGR